MTHTTSLQRLPSTFLVSLAVAASAVSLSACKGGGAEGDDEVGESETQGEEHGDHGDHETGETGEDLVTYWQDVAPIYYDSCVSCHRDGGIGPFTLDDYDSAATWASASALAVDNLVMPPWLVVDDGSCGDWANSRALGQEQIDTILAWVDGGSLQGEPRDDLSVPELPGLDGNTADYATPMFTPEPEGGPLSKFDEYRCFLIDPELAEDTFMTGYEVLPGNEALVHHALMIPVDPGGESDIDGLTNMEVMTALDEESPDRLGWPCFGLAGEGVAAQGIPVTWAPGQGVVDFPANSGFQVHSEELYVVQIHYNMANTDLIGESDSTTIRVRYADEVETQGYFDVPDGLLDTLFEAEPYAIPPGQEAATFTWEMPTDWYIAQDQTELWGFFPHMHEYGVSLTTRILDAEGQEVACVGEVPRWDFGWQLYYFYEEPIILEPGQRIEVTCTYDTTGVEEGITPGWGTYNEMCLAGFYFVP